MKVLIIIIVVLSLPIVFAADPTVSVVTAPSPVALVSGSTAAFSCNATITDLDGYGNITNVNATFFDPAEASETSSDDNNNHYTDSSCTLSNSSGNTTDAFCSFALQYYANPASDWECIITATDDNGTGTATTGQAVNIQELKALTVTSLAFSDSSGGTIDLGATSVETSLNITNTGNVNITVQVNGSAMSCDIGTLALSNIHYNTTSGFSYANGVVLNESPTNVSNFVVAQRTSESTPSIGSLYWLLSMPSDGAGGSCTGTVSVDAN